MLIIKTFDSITLCYDSTELNGCEIDSSKGPTFVFFLFYIKKQLNTVNTLYRIMLGELDFTRTIQKISPIKSTMLNNREVQNI